MHNAVWSDDGLNLSIGPPPEAPTARWGENEHCSLCEVLDRVLNKGAVVMGDLTISVAGIDLLYLQLRVLLTSIKTAWPAAESTP
ncbi:MAG: gas vesicle protein [Candidatus Contendobacter sp.]|nr:gas vesicle protein [Candidatus Contendobacter sp.]